MKSFVAGLSGLTLLLAACQAPAPVLRPSALQARQIVSQNDTQQADRFLCVIEPRGDESSTVKVMNLQNRVIRQVYLPGRVLSLDGDSQRGRLYLSVRSGSQQARFDLYELDVSTLALTRPASFSQAGIQPFDFKTRDQTIFVSGLQQGRGTLTGHSLTQGGWTNLARDFQAGTLEWSRQPEHIQSIHFDEERITRTTIDTRQRRIVSTQTFEHGVPFGNNMGLPAPDGDFFYALHQLQGLVAIYAFDINAGTVNREINTETAVGILFSSVISTNGRFLYATIDNRIERYELVGTSLRRLPAISLNAKEARYISLSSDQRTLYVTHDGQESVSRIRLAPDQVNYQVDEIAFPGHNTRVISF